MITINHQKGRITIDGHAGYAPVGQDIVCAAVSALVQTFIASVEELTADKLTVTQNEQGQITVIEYRNLWDRTQCLMDSFFIGIRMISDSYPQYVRLVTE